jgi:hypothetical protein
MGRNPYDHVGPCGQGVLERRDQKVIYGKKENIAKPYDK